MATPTLPDGQHAAEGVPLLLAPKAAFVFLGVSRRRFFHLKKRPDFPAPVCVPGLIVPYYRRADLAAWVASLQPAEQVTS